jgi:protein SCO1/2
VKPQVLLLGLALVTAPVGAAVDPASFKNFAFRQHPGAQLPLGAQVEDASGRPRTLASAFGGKPAVVILEYLRCTNLCSEVLSGAVHAIDDAGLRPGTDLNLVAISIDPRDGPSDAAAAQAMYARHFREPATAAAGIRFFAGSPDQVRRIAAAIGFPYRYDQPSGQFLHPAGFVVTTPTGKISRYVLGLNPQPELLRKAVAEAGRDEVEPPAHPLLCLCFGYDPDEGSVAALTWKLVRWASFAVLLTCLALIGVLSRRCRTA